MAITIQKESFTEIMDELPPIFEEHWLEVAMDHKFIELDPDWQRYMQMEAQGMLHMMTVRDEGILVGYFVNIVLTHLHYRKSLTAFSDILYLLPDYRTSGKGLSSTGYRLLRATEKMLKGLGVQKSYLMTKNYIPLNMLTKRLKYRLSEKVYTKLL